MAEIVNATAEAAFAWQRPVVWIRVNVGYMLVEAADLSKDHYKVADIETLLGQFNNVFAMFCQAELNVFRAARRMEVDAAQASNMVAALEAMMKAFSPWLRDFHSLVMRRREGSADPSLSLLHSCGAEILNAHKEFVDVADTFLKRIVAR